MQIYLTKEEVQRILDGKMDWWQLGQKITKTVRKKTAKLCKYFVGIESPDLCNNLPYRKGFCRQHYKQYMMAYREGFEIGKELIEEAHENGDNKHELSQKEI